MKKALILAGIISTSFALPAFAGSNDAHKNDHSQSQHSQGYQHGSGHQQHGNGLGLGHESHGNGNGWGHYKFKPVPEIDAAGAAIALALLGGILTIARERRAS